MVEIINIDTINMSMIETKSAKGYNLFDFSTSDFSSLDHILVEITGSADESQITICICQISFNNSIITSNGLFSKVFLTIKYINLNLEFVLITYFGLDSISTSLPPLLYLIGIPPFSTMVSTPVLV